MGSTFLEVNIRQQAGQLGQEGFKLKDLGLKFRVTLLSPLQLIEEQTRQRAVTNVPLTLQEILENIVLLLRKRGKLVIKIHGNADTDPPSVGRRRRKRWYVTNRGA